MGGVNGGVRRSLKMQDYTPVYELYPQRHSTLPKDNDQRKLDIVFFHGLQLASRHNAWETTWTNSQGECWPRDWLPLDTALNGLPVRALSVSYNAQLSGYATGRFGRTAHDHVSISQPLFHALVTRWSVGTVPFVLVGHSYGGLVIKSLVVHCSHNADDYEAKSFMQNLRGVVSYGVPHAGSKLAAHAVRANSCLPLRLSKLVYGLRTYNRENQLLSEQFNVAIQKRGFGGAGVKLFAFAEQLSTNGMLIVPEVSAKGGHRGINEFLVLQQTDHYSMCKPNGRDAEAYAMFVNFLVTKIIAADPALQWGTRPLGRAPPYVDERDRY